MLSSVTISLVEEARGGPFVFWHDLDHACQRAKELGFDALEVFPPSPEAVTKAEVGRKLQHHGLKLAAVGTGAGWVKHRLHLVLPDVTARAHARNFIRSIIDVAGALGAPAILGSMQGRWGEGVTKEVALGYLADALEDLGTYAQQYGVPFLYEPLNRYETNLATTVETSLQLLHRLSTKNVKLLCDLFHMNIEETNLAEALKLGGERVAISISWIRIAEPRVSDTWISAPSWGRFAKLGTGATCRRKSYRCPIRTPPLAKPSQRFASGRTSVPSPHIDRFELEPTFVNDILASFTFRARRIPWKRRFPDTQANDEHARNVNEAGLRCTRNLKLARSIHSARFFLAAPGFCVMMNESPKPVLKPIRSWTRPVSLLKSIVDPHCWKKFAWLLLSPPMKGCWKSIRKDLAFSALL